MTVLLSYDIKKGKLHYNNNNIDYSGINNINCLIFHGFVPSLFLLDQKVQSKGLFI